MCGIARLNGEGVSEVHVGCVGRARLNAEGVSEVHVGCVGRARLNAEGVTQFQPRVVSTLGPERKGEYQR